MLRIALETAQADRASRKSGLLSPDSGLVINTTEESNIYDCKRRHLTDPRRRPLRDESEDIGNALGYSWIFPTLRSIRFRRTELLPPWKLMLGDRLKLYAAIWIVNVINICIWFSVKTAVTSMTAVLTTTITLHIILSVHVSHPRSCIRRLGRIAFQSRPQHTRTLHRSPCEPLSHHTQPDLVPLPSFGVQFTGRGRVGVGGRNNVVDLNSYGPERKGSLNGGNPGGKGRKERILLMR